MSALLKNRPRPTTMTKPRRPVEETGPSCHGPDLLHTHPEAEAPEEAIREVESPEFREEHDVEAPDAGTGECHSIEREFTHGRSRS
jgi:hypothetical protein